MKYIKIDENLTNESLQLQYRNWAKKLHPDAGGSQADFQELTKEYQTALSFLENKNTNNTSDPVKNLVNQAKQSMGRHLRNAFQGFMYDISEELKKNL